MTDKVREKIRKLQALAERGVGGEKETAKNKLEKMLRENGISSLEELEQEKAEYFLFSYNGRHEIKLLRQCVYKVLGASADRTSYRSRGKRQKIGYYCTAAQKVEIELEFEFYRNVFYEELDDFMTAFIIKQGIFPEDAPKTDWEDLTEKEKAKMAKLDLISSGIKRRKRVAMLEEKAE